MTDTSVFKDGGEAPQGARAVGGEGAAGGADAEAFNAGHAPHPGAGQDVPHAVTDTAAAEPAHGGFVHGS